MRCWIEDPANGVINVRSQMLLTVWDKFRANCIRTPLAQVVGTKFCAEMSSPVARSST